MVAFWSSCICILAVLVLAACAGEVDCGGSFALDVGAADELTVRSAAERFDAFAGTTTTIGATGVCTITTRTPLTASRRGWATAEWVGDEGEIRIDIPRIRAACDGQPDECAQAFVMHELGHAYGLGHVEPFAGIMGEIINPTLPQGRAFSEADRAECRRAGVCR